MATLKEHQAAMVDLLANGSGIPASASRLAHAMHDLLVEVMAQRSGAPEGFGLPLYSQRKAMREQETTPGLNDKDLAGFAATKRLKVKGGMFDRAMAAEQRVKELENTIKQLRTSNKVLRAERDELRAELDFADAPGQPKCACLPEYYEQCDVCDPPEPEQAGCRKEDTQACEHDFRLVAWCSDLQQCSKCGAAKQ